MGLVKKHLKKSNYYLIQLVTKRGNNMKYDCPLTSISDTLGFYCRDLSLDHRDAWIYGIVVGWDDDSMKEMMERHKWNDKTVQRLQRLHKEYIELL